MKKDDFFPSKYLTASDLEGDMDVTILNVAREKFENEFKPIVDLEETDKQLVLNKTNFTTIANLHGPDTKDWKDKRITLYATEVDFKGQATMAIRVRLSFPGAKQAAADPGTISIAQRKLLFNTAMEVFKGKNEAEGAIKKILDVLGLKSTGELGQDAFAAACQFIETDEAPDEWAMKGLTSLREDDDVMDDVPF